MLEPTPDRELVREFAERGSERAFETLVRRHVNLVFATALRRLDDAGAAHEVTQNVFVVLARKAAWLRGEKTLAAWLHKVTLLESRQWWRGQLARQRRESTAVDLGTTMKDDDSVLKALGPILDEGLVRLREQQRQAVLLHYFENRTYRDIGAALGIGEDAARKRVARGLDLLRLFFRRQGYALPTAEATAAILRSSAHAAPDGIASLATKTALSSGSAASISVIGLFIGKFLALTKTQTAVVCALLASPPIAHEWHAIAKARLEQEVVRTKLVDAQNELTGRQLTIQQTKRRLAGLEAQLADIQSNIGGFRARLSDLRAGDTNPYLWSEHSDYVRIPKGLLNQVTISDSPDWRPLSMIGRSREPGAGNAGWLPSVLIEILGITPDQTHQMTVSFQEARQQYEQLAESQSYITSTPPAAASVGSGHTLTIVMNSFPIEGQALKENLRTSIKGVLGPERTEVVWNQAEVIFRDQFDDFGEKERIQTATVRSDGGVSIWKGLRVPGETDFFSQSSTGGLRLEDVPSAFRDFVTEMLKRAEAQQ